MNDDKNDARLENPSGITDADPRDGQRGVPTPGPWIVETDVFGKLDISVFAGVVRYDSRIAMIQGRESPDDTSPPRETALANAHLIAAAPDLLAACHKFIQSMRSGQREKCDVALVMANAAVAKAEGRSRESR